MGVGVARGRGNAPTGLGSVRAAKRVGWGRKTAVGVVATLLLSGGATVVQASPVQPSAPVAPRVDCDDYYRSLLTTEDSVTSFDGVELTDAQVAAATELIAVAQELQISRRGTRIALAVALELSGLDTQARSGDRSGLFQQASLSDGDGTRTFFATLTQAAPGYDADPRPDWQIAEQVTEGAAGRNTLQWFGVSQALNDKLNPQLAFGAGTVRAVAPNAPEVRAGSAGLMAVGNWLPVTTQPSPEGVEGLEGTTAVVPQVTSGMQPLALRGGVAAFRLAEDGDDQGAASPAAATEPEADGTTDQQTSQASTETSAAETSTVETSVATTSTVETTAPATTEVVTTTGEPEPSETGTGTTQPPASTEDPTGTEPTDGTGTSGTEPPTGGTETPTGTTGTGTGEPTGTTLTTPPATTGPSTPGTPTGATPTTGTPPATGGSQSPPAGESSSGTETTPPTTPSEPDRRPVEPPVVDQVDPVPDTTDDDPNHGPDAPPADHGGAGAPIDCAPDTAGRSTSFDPGMIISDAVFYDTDAMTVEQVRAFLDVQGAGCTGPWCLRNLTVDVPPIPGDKYCAEFAGGQGLDAAEVIVGLSAACGINPQVMLVTLQKESALVTRTGVTEASYNAAFGWHCPDTGPGGTANCDPAFAGFVNQTAGMAKQWSRYKVDPDKYRYRAGTTVTILWNVVESGCGGSAVHIRNTATASLYNYTPYQPNAAALASYPGVGDSCSTYGNRNFFMLFSKWFGTTGGGASAEVLRNGVDITIPAGPTVAAGAAGKVITAPNAQVAKGIAAGLATLGMPYVWGGGTAGGAPDQGCVRGGGASNSCQGVVGFDCSGLTMYVMRQAGFTIPDHSAAQRSAGTPVAWDKAVAGDIIGWPGHVAVYLGRIDGVPYLLEAPTVGMSVQVRPVYYANGGQPVDGVMYRYWS